MYTDDADRSFKETAYRRSCNLIIYLRNISRNDTRINKEGSLLVALKYIEFQIEIYYIYTIFYTINMKEDSDRLSLYINSSDS